jgi:hypothetical protein
MIRLVASTRCRSLSVVVLCLGVGGSLLPALALRSAPARWHSFLHVPGIVDLTRPRSDGSFTVAADGALSTLPLGGQLTPFARGPDGYATRQGPEPYIALGGGQTPEGAGCSFPADDVFALEPSDAPGVIEVDAQGHARRFADLEPGTMPNGIAFDDVGRFGHRLLVTAALQGGSALFALDCAGGVTTITRQAPLVEGGLEVAPNSFGRFGGDLIAPDELSGRVYAIGPTGAVRTVARSGLPHGQDIGVESAGFVPPRFGRAWSAYLADRGVPGNPHPGTDSILRLSGGSLVRAGVQPGDLLVASEGGAQTIAVRCARTCSVRHIADGPAPAHAEGHIVFANAGSEA